MTARSASQLFSIVTYFETGILQFTLNQDNRMRIKIGLVVYFELTRVNIKINKLVSKTEIETRNAMFFIETG